MKIVKILFWTIVTIVALVLAVVLTLPLWIKPVGTGVANKVGPELTKAPFHLGNLELNYYSGNFRLGDLQVSNPENCGYSEKDAATLGDLHVEFDTTSLLTDVIHVRLISVKDVFASYVSSQGTNNIDHLMLNVLGEKKQGEEKKEAKEEKSSKKIIIDRVEIAGVKVKLGIVPIPVPPITITDIGKDTGGIGIDVAWEEIWNKIMNSISGVAGSMGDLGKGALEGLSTGLSAGGDAASKAAKGAAESAGKAASAVSDAASNAAKGAAEGAGKAASAVSDAASKAAESLGSGSKKAVEDAASAVKNLFNYK